MKISEKKKTELYEAIHQPIMRRRLSVQQIENTIGKDNSLYFDNLMVQLQAVIWTEVKRVLSI